MEAEHGQLALQRSQATHGEQRRALLFQRRSDGLQFQRELVHACVRRRFAERRRRRDVLRQRLGARRKARVDAADGPAIGLVLAVRRQIGRALGERVHLRGHVRQPRRQPELAAEQVHFLQVVREQQPRVQPLGRAQHVGAHVRVAVAIAADPAAHREKRRQPRQLLEREAFLQRVLELGIEPRQLLQEGEAEIVDAVGDFVGHLQLGGAQHRGEPQAQHFGMDRLVALAAGGLRDQACDFALAFEDALALHLGRMRREHRAHVCAREPCHQLAETDIAHFVERV